MDRDFKQYFEDIKKSLSLPSKAKNNRVIFGNSEFENDEGVYKPSLPSLPSSSIPDIDKKLQRVSNFIDDKILPLTNSQNKD